MNQPIARKTFRRKLTLTPKQEQEFDGILGLRRKLDSPALEQRIAAWQRHHGLLARFEHEAGLKDICAAFPEYEAVHSHVLQDVLARLDETYQAFFHRAQRGRRRA